MSATTIVLHTSDSATTILAVLGVVLALLSLAWQAATFYLSGSRVSVEIRSGVRSATAAATIPGTAPVTHLEQMRSQGLEQAVLGVRVHNSGRSPTSVVSIDLLLPKGASYSQMGFDPPLPFRLEAESEETWHIDADDVRAYAATLTKVLGDGEEWHVVRGRVRVGGRDKPIVSKNEARIP
jgi:hypothetical protein